MVLLTKKQNTKTKSYILRKFIDGVLHAFISISPSFLKINHRFIIMIFHSIKIYRHGPSFIHISITMISHSERGRSPTILPSSRGPSPWFVTRAFIVRVPRGSEWDVSCSSEWNARYFGAVCTSRSNVLGSRELSLNYWRCYVTRVSTPTPRALRQIEGTWACLYVGDELYL